MLADADADNTTTSWRRVTPIVILAIACATRFIALDDAPPGIHHDEATNGYDAYSILKTGQDRWGHSFPVLLEAFGRSDYRAALYAYLIVPFEALLGPNRLTLATRMPSAFFGVLTVAALYGLVRRVHGQSTALWAASFLTLSPWHLQLSRFGHESSLSTAFTVFALYALSLASFPQLGARRAMIRGLPLVGAAGLFALGLYTYPSMRLFTPLLIITGITLFARDNRPAFTVVVNRVWLVAASVIGALVALPLVSLAGTSWDQFAGRAREVFLFNGSQPFGVALMTALKQYAAHFGPDWLFLHGDTYRIQSPPGFGQLSFVVAPFLIVGIVVAWKRRREDRIGWFLLAWLLLHPIAASITDSGPHALRSACGIGVFEWLAAIGCQSLVSLCGTQRRRVVAAVCAMALAGNGGFVVYDYFARWARDPWVAALYQRDLRDALRAVRPIVRDFDRIHISIETDRDKRWYSGEPYILVLLTLPVEPADFHRWSKSVVYDRPTDGFHRVESFGPFVMSTSPEVLDRYFREFPNDRVLVIARPGEIRGGRLIETIRNDNGEPRFEIIAVEPNAGSAKPADRP